MTAAEYIYYLGLGYLNGINCDRDSNLGKARDFILQAAEMGYLEAMRRLWIMYKSGDGVERDNKQAAYWYDRYRKNGGTEECN